MLKAVVDTNVLVSGTIRKSGHPNRIMNAWRKGLFVLVTSESLIEEAARVFRYPRICRKYGLTEDRINRILKSLTRYALIAPGQLRINVIKEDPDAAVLDIVAGLASSFADKRRNEGWEIVE